MWWPELVLHLNEQIVVATVVPLHMQIKNTFIIKTFAARAHQRWQPEVMQQRVKNKPCHRHEVLVAGLAFLQEIYHLHGSVPDVLAPMGVLESIRTNLAAVQAD